MAVTNKTINDHLHELSRILESIEEKHGTVQAAGDHRYVRELHRQARYHITQMQRAIEESSDNHK